MKIFRFTHACMTGNTRFLLLCLGLITSSLSAAPLSVAMVSRKTPVDFPSEVYPVLKANCISCHNKTTTKAGLNMETPELMKKGGETGPAIEPGKGTTSLLLQSAAHMGESDMPPKGNKVGAVNLTTDELGLLKLWIDQGAKPGQKVARDIAWKPLPPGLHPIYAVAMSPGGQLTACSRANQIFFYDLATRKQVAQLDAHRDMTLALVFSPDGMKLASGSFGEVKLWKREPATLAPGPDAKQLMDAKAKVQQFDRTVALAALDVTFYGSVVTTTSAEVTVLKDRVKKAGDAIADTKKKLDEKRAAVKPATDARVAAQKVLDEMNAQIAKILAAKPDAVLVNKQTEAKAKLEAAVKSETVAIDAVKAAETAATAASAELLAVTKQLVDAEKTATPAEVIALKDRVKKAGDAIADTKKNLDEKRAAVKPATDARVAAQKALDEMNAQIAKILAAKPDAALVNKQTEAKTKLEVAIKAETVAIDAVKPAETAATDAIAELPRVTKQLADTEKTAADAKTAQTNAQQTQKKITDDLAAANKALAETIKSLAVLVLSPDQRWLIEPQADGNAVVWTVPDGMPVAKLILKPGAKAALTWKPDNQLIVPVDGVLQDLSPKWALERSFGTGDLKSEIEDRVNAIAFSPDGKTLAIGSGEPSRGGDITLWDVASGKLVRSLRDRHSDTVLSLDFSPDGRLIASGGADKQLRISEIASGKQLKVFEGHTHHVMGVSWRADGRVLASSGADNAAKVWDWIKGERRKNLDGWDKEVTSVHYLGAGTRLLTTSGDKQVRLIGEDGSAPVILAGSTDFMQACATSPDGQWAAAGGEDSVLRVWETKGGAPVGTFAKP